MIMSGQYLNYIIRELNIIRYEIKSKNSLNLTDDNIHMQRFVGDVLNMVYGYNLVNLNKDGQNFPGIDLGDVKHSVGFQLTSTKTGQKIKDTLKKCNNNPCCHIYKTIKFFVLTEKQNDYSGKFETGIFSFNPKSDVLDFDDLYKHILDMELKPRKQLCEYIQCEIPELLNNFGIDYFDQPDFKRIERDVAPDDWALTNSGSLYKRDSFNRDLYTFTIVHGFGYTPSNTVLLNDDNIVCFCDVKVTEEIATFIIDGHKNRNFKAIISS